MLIVLSGLPGTGKSTIGKALAVRLSATYVRVDEIEQALKRHRGEGEAVGSAGYAVAMAIARSNLSLGKTVIADSVNPVPESRAGWRSTAYAVDGQMLVEVELICSDLAEHQRRIEQREPDIAGFKTPSWSSVQSHHYIPWTEARLVIDTARMTAIQAVDLIEQNVAKIEALSRTGP